VFGLTNSSAVEAAARAALDRRLDAAAPGPLAVGLSGGGDSLALLILTLAWARAHRRPVLALVVDHQLQPASAAWTASAIATARRLGAEARALAWEGVKPESGLPAAARDARHRLLADAARAAGAKVLLLGHTADDRAEAAVMRAEGSSVGDPREWSPSPVWPEGRGVFLLRPLLTLSRADLRTFLRKRGEGWLDDPANDDPKFARARARTSLAGDTPPPDRGDQDAPPYTSGDDGVVTLPRSAVTPNSLAAACLCAAGHDRPPRRREIEALAARLTESGPVVATLAGARIEADEVQVRIAREPGRQGLPEIALPAVAAVIWDGRFEIAADEPGLTVRALGGLATRLPPEQRVALARIPAFARAALPALVAVNGAVNCPLLAERAGVRIASLVSDRFAAACGVVTRECEGGDRARGEMKREGLSCPSVV